MMKQTLDAIYENGVFTPLKPPKIIHGQRVRLTVESRAAQSSDDLLELAAQVYQGLSEKEIDEVEQIALTR